MTRIDLRGSTEDPRRLLPRAAFDVAAAIETVRPVVEAIREHGAPAIRDAVAQAGATMADVVKAALLIVQPEQQRSDPLVLADRSVS